MNMDDILEDDRQFEELKQLNSTDSSKDNEENSIASQEIEESLPFEELKQLNSTDSSKDNEETNIASQEIEESLPVEELQQPNLTNNCKDVKVNDTASDVSILKEIEESLQIEEVQHLNSTHNTKDIKENDIASEVSILKEIEESSCFEELQFLNSTDNSKDIKENCIASQVSDSILKEIEESSSFEELQHMISTADSKDIKENEDASLALEDTLKEIEETSPAIQLSDEDEDDLPAKAPSSRNAHKMMLPYFQMPKPDLEEFLLEASQKFSTRNIVNGTNANGKECFKPTTSKGAVTFDLDTFQSPIDVFRNKFKKQFQEKDRSSRVSAETINCFPSANMDYIKDMKETQIPGSKRLILNKYLKKRMDEKKLATFKKTQEMIQLDEEMSESEYLQDSGNEEEYDDKETSLQVCPISNPFSEISEPHHGSKDNLVESDASENETEDCVVDGHESLGHNFFQRTQKSLGEAGSLNSSNDECSSDDEGETDNHRDHQSKAMYVSELDSDDEGTLQKKPRRCVQLEDDSDDEIDNDPEVICIEKNHLNRTELEGKDSTGSGDSEISSDFVHIDANKIYADKDRDLKHLQKSCQEIEGGFSSSAIPSFQPHGGFLSQDDNSVGSFHDSNDLANDKSLIETTKDIFSTDANSDKRSPSYVPDDTQSKIGLDNSVLDSYSMSNTPEFRFKLQDLPVSVGDSTMLTQDIANVCSGKFEDPVSDSCPENLTTDNNTGEKVFDFFDDEAELSGDDFGGDDDPEDNEENEECIVFDEEMPSDEELRSGIADLYMKRLHDDDAQEIKRVQENFLDHGELNNETGRSRRFIWSNNAGESSAVVHDSSDSETEGVTDDSKNLEKAKFDLERAKRQIEAGDGVINLDSDEEVNTGLRKTPLELKIVKSQDNTEDFPKRNVRKRARGSLLNIEEKASSKVLKKLKTDESNPSGDSGGAKSRKHWVFHNSEQKTVPVVHPVGKENVNKKEHYQNGAGCSTWNDSSVFSKM